jgi:protoporphyrinogen oxidase
MESYKYIIIGGGLSGLTAAYELTKIANPEEILLLEK